MSNDWSLTLNLSGGRIQDLSHKGIRVLGMYNRIDGKVGNTHLCIPSFDKEGQDKYGLPFHGLVRNIEWRLEKKSISSLTILCKTPSSDYYPAQLSVEQEFILSKEFQHIIRVRNVGNKAVPVNSACHYYWDTPSGWNTTTVNREDVSEKIETNGHIDLDTTNIIRFPHTSYRLLCKNIHSAALWTSFTTDTHGKKVFSSDFCCIEPVIKWPGYFGTKESIVRPGETISASISLENIV